MKRPLLTLAVLAATAMAACRIYDVDVNCNIHGWTDTWPNNAVSQTFINTCDSALTWASFFVGAGNLDGVYDIEIQTMEGERILYGHTDSCGPTKHYQYMRADLERWGSEPPIKGKEYELKISHSAGEPINFYYDPTDPYPYGKVSVPGGQFHPPPQNYSPDLAARIEGANEPDSQEVAKQKYPDLSVDSVWTEPEEPTILRPVRFFVKLTNQGTASWNPVAGRHDSLLVFTANGVPAASASNLPLIRIGGSATVRSTGTWQVQQQGDCLVCAEVSINQKVAVELDRDNNAKYRMFEIR